MPSIVRLRDMKLFSCKHFRGEQRMPVAQSSAASAWGAYFFQKGHGFPSMARKQASTSESLIMIMIRVITAIKIDNKMKNMMMTTRWRELLVWNADMSYRPLSDFYLHLRTANFPGRGKHLIRISRGKEEIKKRSRVIIVEIADNKPSRV